MYLVVVELRSAFALIRVETKKTTCKIGIKSMGIQFHARGQNDEQRCDHSDGHRDKWFVWVRTTGLAPNLN